MNIFQLSQAKEYLGRLFGVGEVNVTPDAGRRVAVATFAVIGAAFLVVFGLFQLFSDEFRVGLQGALQLVEAALFLFPILLLVQRGGAPATTENALVVAGFVIFLTLLLCGGIAGDAAYWTLVYPYLVFFLKGQRIGWLIGLAYAVVAPMLMIYSTHHWPLLAYDSFLALFYGVAVLFNTCVAAAFNLLRSTFHARLWEEVKFNTNEVRRHLLAQQYNATHDVATGLPNREGFIQALALEHGKSPNEGCARYLAAVSFLRAQELSSIAGMQAVSLLMHDLAGELHHRYAEIRQIGRHRQGELCLLIESPQPVAEIVELLAAISQLPLAARGGDFSLHGEYIFGLVALEGDGAGDGEQWLRKAEQALLHASYTRQRYALYDAEVERKFVRYHTLYEKVRQAIEQCALMLHYQPQIDLASGKVAGAEALVRWRDPQEGWISPADFIPIVETTGLLQQFSIWTISRALRDCADWQLQLPGKTVSINLSAGALHDPQVVAAMEASLRQCDLAPGLVVVELTESVMLDAPQEALAAMQRLVALGCTLSIDDYGSGFSSLTYIKQLPAHELKIDKSFVTDCQRDSRDRAIITSTIALGHEFGLKVLAEGVEDGETASLLQAGKCDLAQGWHYARAMPLAEFVEWSIRFEQAQGK